MNKHTTFRLSQEAKEKLKEMAKEKGISMTAVLEVLIRKGWKR